MLSRAIEDISVADLERLISDQVPEGRTLEYKRDMSSSAESKEVPMLAAVSSFGNTSGGDLLIGVEAVDGVATALPGVEVDNLDKETLRLEQIVRDSIDPRMPRVEFRAIHLSENRYVWLVRVPASWIAPHRVRRNSKFYARNSAGRYELDVSELRLAFSMTETIAGRIREYRTDRIARINAGRTPVPLMGEGSMVVHVVPLQSFMTRTSIDIAVYGTGSTPLRPMGAGGWNHRINLDGFVTFESHGQKNSFSYTQMFRTGVAEAAFSLSSEGGTKALPSVAFEHYTLEMVKEYLSFAMAFEVEAPFLVFLSLVGARGCILGMNPGIYFGGGNVPLTEDVLTLPEVVIEENNEQLHPALKPAFDMMWNAFGLARSLNYDEMGNWVAG